MGIQIEDVIRMLPDNTQVICKRPTAKVLGIKRLRDLRDEPDPRQLYVSGALEKEKAVQYRDINLLLYSPGEVENVAGQNGNLMVIHDRQGYEDVLQRLLDILAMQSSLSDVSNDMMMLIRNGGDVHKLLKYAYDLLNNPLMLVDVSFNYIDSVGTEGLNEEAWVYAIENKVLPLNYINHIMNSVRNAGGRNISSDDLRIEPANEVTSATQYSLRVHREGIVLGYIKILEKNRPVTEFDLQVFCQLSYYLSFSNIGERRLVPNTDSLSDSFLRSLLEGTLTDKNEILARQAMFNIKLYDVLHVIVIKFEGATMANDQIYYTLHKIRAFFSGNIVSWFNDSFVVLHDSRDKNSIWSPAWAERLSSMLLTLKCTANFSTSFTALPDMVNYYRQALFCVELRNLFRDCPPVLRYEDVFEYHMIINLGKQVDLMDLIHPAVATLMKLEAQGSDPNLLETLFIYNRNHCNISTTAKEMYLHYNTMKHRISRIAELTGFTGENSRDFFLIALSEKILEVCRRQAENWTGGEKKLMELGTQPGK